jgi:hypothetical protein
VYDTLYVSVYDALYVYVCDALYVYASLYLASSQPASRRVSQQPASRRASQQPASVTYRQHCQHGSHQGAEGGERREKVTAQLCIACNFPEVATAVTSSP